MQGCHEAGTSHVPEIMMQPLAHAAPVPLATMESSAGCRQRLRGDLKNNSTLVIASGTKQQIPHICKNVRVAIATRTLTPPTAD